MPLGVGKGSILLLQPCQAALAKIDLRCGRILECSKVPDADSLYLLKACQQFPCIPSTSMISYHIFHQISAESELNEFLLTLRSTSERISPDRPGAGKPVRKIRILPLLALVATSSWSGLAKVVSSLVGHYTADELQNRQVRRRNKISDAAYRCVV